MSRLGDLLHLHLPSGAYEEQLDIRLLLFQRAGDGDRRKDMAACSAACYNDALAHAGIASPSISSSSSSSTSAASRVLPAPSLASAFRATLRMMPMARQVNKNELPPILTSGSVTPVTGNKLTVTAIFARAWITRVKLSPRARNAPNAKGQRRKMRILRSRNTR